ncbi:multidrug efflux protein [Hydrogenophaga sp. T4]|nr:multidrug efflux protein [Hydrogenophaga sp. T4]
MSLGVIRQATANPLELAAGVRQLLEKVKTDLPPGINVEIANDNSVFIDRSIKPSTPPSPRPWCWSRWSSSSSCAPSARPSSRW